MNRLLIAAGIILASTVHLMAQPLADHIPAGVLVYVGWSGSDNLGSEYAQTHLKAVLDSCDLPKVFTEFLPGITAKLGQQNPKVGEAMQTASSLITRYWQHPSALYWAGIDFSNPNDPMPRFAVMCDAGADAPSLARDLQSAVDKLGHTPMPIKVSTQGTLVTLQIGPESAGVSGQPNLAADAQFKSAMAAVQPKPLMAVYVSPHGIVDLIDQIPATSPSDKQSKAQVAKVVDALGLKGATALAWSGGFDGKDWSTKAFLAAPSPRTGLLAGLDATPVSPDALKLVPSSATMVAATTFDPAQLVDGIRRAAGSIDANAPAQIDNALEQFHSMTNLDLQKDIFAPLGDQWVAYSDPTLGGSYSFCTVLMNRLRDPAKAEASLTQLAQNLTAFVSNFTAGENIRFTVRETSFGGVTIHFLGTPLLRPSWAVHDGVLYAGLFPQIVAAAASHPPAAGKSILDHPPFVALFQRLGQHEATSLTYLDLPRTVPLMYPTWMTLSGYAGVGDLFGVPSPAMIVPPLNVLLDQLSPAGSVSWVDDAGWHGAGQTPFPGATVLGSDASFTVAVPALMVSILLPSLNRARETANRVKCASNERQIGQAILLYSNDHRGKYPPDLGTLIKEEDITPEVFTCPTSNNTVPSEVATGTKDVQAAWVNANSSYVYVGKNMNNTAGSEVVVVYEKNDDHGHDGMNLLYGDGHVAWENLQSAQRQIHEPGLRR